MIVGEVRGEPVALKVVRFDGPQAEGLEVAIERARREFAALNRTENRHVVGVRSDFHEIGPDRLMAAAWAEEYIDGDDVDALMDHPWTWAATAEFMTDTAEGLRAFHAQGLVHRDLSPANVRRRASDGSYVVLDPGFARFVDFTTITHAGQPATPGYGSPEHYDRSEGPTYRSDIYQLSVLAHRALTTRLPFPVGGDMQQHVQQLLAGDPPSITLYRDDLDPHQAAIIDGCLRRLPARRFREIGHLLDHLERSL